MKLNLRQIEVFRAIMLSGSISGASKLLFVSQPAVSRLIAYTEQRLGLMLFERIKGRLYPTPEARRLFVEVTALYQNVQRVNEVADNLAENREGQLRLSCSPSLGQSLLPRAIARFRQLHPEIRIVLQTLIPAVMEQSLLTQQVELLSLIHISSRVPLPGRAGCRSPACPGEAVVTASLPKRRGVVNRPGVGRKVARRAACQARVRRGGARAPARHTTPAGDRRRP